MAVSPKELRLLEEACANRENEVARALLNAFGATSAVEMLDQLKYAPVTIRNEFMDYVHRAIDSQRTVRRR